MAVEFPHYPNYPYLFFGWLILMMMLGGVYVILFSLVYFFAFVLGLMDYFAVFFYIKVKQPKGLAKLLSYAFIIGIGLPVASGVVAYSLFMIGGLVLGLHSFFSQPFNYTIGLFQLIYLLGMLLGMIFLIVLVIYIFIYCPVRYLWK